MKAPLQPGKSFGSVASSSAPAQRKSGLKTITDNRPTAIAQRKLRGVVEGKKRVVQRTLDEAIRKLGDNPRQLDGKDSQDCGTGAYYAFYTLSNTDKKRDYFQSLDNVGISSLRKTMQENASANGEFLYYINADGLVGHRFTILQNGQEAAIFQGYSREYSVMEKLPEANKPISEILLGLNILKTGKDEYKKNCTRGNDNTELLKRISLTHKELFLLPIDGISKLGKMYVDKFGHKTLNDIEWYVQEIGERALLQGSSNHTSSQISKKGCCTIL